MVFEITWEGIRVIAKTQRNNPRHSCSGYRKTKPADGFVDGWYCPSNINEKPLPSTWDQGYAGGWQSGASTKYYERIATNAIALFGGTGARITRKKIL
jgi:hypothetical protein